MSEKNLLLMLRSRLLYTKDYSKDCIKNYIYHDIGANYVMYANDNDVIEFEAKCQNAIYIV